MKLSAPLIVSIFMLLSSANATLQSIRCRLRPTGTGCATPTPTPNTTMTTNTTMAMGSSLYFSVLNNAQNEHFNCAQNKASGSAVATLFKNSTFCIRLSYTDLSTPELFSHIHGPAAVGTVAPVIVTLNVEPTKTGCYLLTATQIQWLNDGMLYFNIHSNSTNCAAGEIRGQILRSA